MVVTNDLKSELSTLSQDLIRTLLYFSIFKYPLTSEELYQNSSLKEISHHDVREELIKLCQSDLIQKRDQFYYTGSDSSIVLRRVIGNHKAERSLMIAKKMGNFVASFPYVRGVFISGSLSKGYMDEKSDIDFFIVTEPGRLWLSRTLIILFKKIFLFNSHKYLCPNYFINSNNLEIEEKNLFTAKELSYLYPIYNQSLFEEMLARNEWAKVYMPNFEIKKEGKPVRKRLLKTFLEYIFNFKVGAWLDSFCMKITERYWKNKYKAKYGVESSILCSKHVSKYHPQGFQNKVITAFSEKLKEFEVIKRIKLS